MNVPAVRWSRMSDITDLLAAFSDAHRAEQDVEAVQGDWQTGDDARLLPALQRASAAHHRAADECDQLIEKLQPDTPSNVIHRDEIEDEYE